MALLSFDDAWKSSCERVEQLPNNETYSVVLTKCRKTLSDVLSKVSGHIYCYYWSNHLYLLGPQEHQYGMGDMDELPREGAGGSSQQAAP